MLFMGVGSALIGAASRDIGLTATQIGLLIAAQNVGFVFSVTISGAMADSRPLPRIAFIGSIILGVSFLTFYPVPSFRVNLAIMPLFGVGLGTIEPLLVRIREFDNAAVPVVSLPCFSWLCRQTNLIWLATTFRSTDEQ